MAPRVTEEYRSERRAVLVDAAAACFARGGFHGTSVHDICAEAGISPGAFYGYFPSKEALVGAMCELDDDAALLEGLADQTEHPAAVLEMLVDHFFGQIGSGSHGRADTKVNVQLWAEAARPGEIRDAIAGKVDTLVAAFSAWIAGQQDAGRINPALDARSIARVMVGTHQAAVLASAMDPDFDLDIYMTTIKALFMGQFLEPDDE